MAAAQVLALVILLIIHIQEAEIVRKGGTYEFEFYENADTCSVSRFVGEEKILLWNSSLLHDSYHMNNLQYSDTAGYQRQCWTRDKVTHEINFTLVVCDFRDHFEIVTLNVGKTKELRCEGAGSNQSLQWFTSFYNLRTHLWEDDTLISGETFSVNHLQVVRKNTSLLLSTNASSGLAFFMCVADIGQHCVSLSDYQVAASASVIYRSVGDSLELTCTGAEISGQPHLWKRDNSPTEGKTSSNYTLRIPSLTLSHSGTYTCASETVNTDRYILMVCPRLGPPAVMLFTRGENVTLRCGSERKQPVKVHWFKNWNKTDGRVMYAVEDGDSNMDLLIPNVTAKDTVEYVCVIMEKQCGFSLKILLKEYVFDHCMVRSALLSVLLAMMFGAVVAVTWWAQSKKQNPVYMNQLQSAVRE